jgi:hypothetical protein
VKEADMRERDPRVSKVAVTLADGSETRLDRLRNDAVLVLVFLRHFG